MVRSGTPVTLTGSNYVPGSTVTVKFDSTTVLTVTGTATGAIPSSGNTFVVPTALAVVIVLAQVMERTLLLLKRLR